MNNYVVLRWLFVSSIESVDSHNQASAMDRE